jgi:uncharacterized protein YcbK (DUF882 family)
MNDKITYKLTVQMDDTEVLIIEPPFTLEFDIVRNTMAQANTGTFRVYNLSESIRNSIFQDLFDLSTFRKVTFEAGYGELISCFVGDLRKAYSYRQGTEIITEMFCFDGGYDTLNAFTNQSFGAGVELKEVITSMIGGMRDVAKGEVGEVAETSLPRGTALIGNSIEILDKYTDGGVFIDEGKLNVLKPNEVIEGLVTKLDSSSGLLGTPKRQDASLLVDTIFNPKLKVAQVIDIESEVQKQFNGQYKIVGIKHGGIISENTCGERKTEITLFMPNALNNQAFNLVSNGKITPLEGNEELNQNIKGVYAYLLKYNKPPKFNITKNISWSEALHQYSSQGGTPTIQVLSNLVRLSKVMQEFLDKNYPGKSIKISSGWRSKGTNSSTPNASNTSLHVKGLAFDFVIQGVSIAEQQRATKEQLIGEIITYSGFTHYGLQSTREILKGDR